jgi:hypothetical protein
MPESSVLSGRGCNGILLIVLGLLVTAGQGCRSQPRQIAGTPTAEDRALIGQIDAALVAASRFLVSAQSPDGAWRSTVYGPYRDGPSLTPYVLTALHLSGRDAAARESFEQGRRYVMRLGLAGDGRANLATPVYTAAPACWVLRVGVQTSDTIASRENWVRFFLARTSTQRRARVVAGGSGIRWVGLCALRSI